MTRMRAFRAICNRPPLAAARLQPHRSTTTTAASIRHRIATFFVAYRITTAGAQVIQRAERNRAKAVTDLSGNRNNFGAKAAGFDVLGKGMNSKVFCKGCKYLRQPKRVQLISALELNY